MKVIYGIFAIAGWVWAAIVFAYLYIRLRRPEARGFEVLTEQHEKQP